MNDEQYREYLKSEHWQRVRDSALERALRLCQVCNGPDGLEVHHRTYERIGNERSEDVTVLCDACHTLFHERMRPELKTVTIQDALREAYERVDTRNRGDQLSPSGVPTGYLDLDNLTAGFQNSELVIVAARPSVGKTAFALNLTRHIAVDKELPVFFVSLEQSRVELAERLMCCQARVNTHKLRKGHLSSDDMQKLIEVGDTIRKAGLVIDDSSRQTIPSIVASAHRLCEEKRIRAVFIDKVELIEPANLREPRAEQIAGIARRLKRLAKDLEIPIIALAGVAKESENRQDHRPRLADLFDALCTEADTVLLLHRAELYEPGPHEGVAEVQVAKQRNGPTGEIMLTFVKQFMRFENFAAQSPFGYDT